MNKIFVKREIPVENSKRYSKISLSFPRLLALRHSLKNNTLLLWRLTDSQKITILCRHAKKHVKMRPLATNQRVLVWFCVYRFDDEPNFREKIFSILFTLITWIENLCGILATTVFLWKNVSIEIEVYLFAIFQLFALLSMTNICAIILISRQKIANLFKSLSEIYETSKW